MVFQVLRAFLSPSFAKFTSSKSAICMLLQSNMHALTSQFACHNLLSCILLNTFFAKNTSLFDCVLVAKIVQHIDYLMKGKIFPSFAYVHVR